MLTFIEHLFCACHYTNHFTCVIYTQQKLYTCMGFVFTPILFMKSLREVVNLSLNRLQVVGLGQLFLSDYKAAFLANML